MKSKCFEFYFLGNENRKSASGVNGTEEIRFFGIMRLTIVVKIIIYLNVVVCKV